MNERYLVQWPLLMCVLCILVHHKFKPLWHRNAAGVKDEEHKLVLHWLLLLLVHVWDLIFTVLPGRFHRLGVKVSVCVHEGSSLHLRYKVQIHVARRESFGHGRQTLDTEAEQLWPVRLWRVKVKRTLLTLHCLFVYVHFSKLSSYHTCTVLY